MIREAQAEDVPAICELVVRAWRWAYVDIVAEDRMPTVLQLAVEWSARGVSDAWVAEVDGVIAGVAAIDRGAQELTSLYVEPAAQGAGVGTMLHDRALAELSAAGSGAALLWVFRENGQARNFFHRLGWRLDRQASKVPDRCSAAPAIRLVHGA